MHLIDVDPTDDAQLELVVRLVERARAHDDPDAFAQSLDDARNEARYGGDLHPARHTVLLDDDDEPVGHVWLHVPQRDNLGLVEAGITVDPGRRGRGLGGLLLAEVERRTRALGRTTLWVGTADDDERAREFLIRRGFALATRDARRHQRLAEVDAVEIDRLEQEAAAHARDYVVERLRPPYDDATLTAMIAVTAAINDAPMGALTFEDEVYDLDRMRDIEQAMELRAERFRRVAARHRETGEVAGHTALTVRPWAPSEAYQWDTSVARDHRGHRLGLALKIAMMRWLAEEEPQLEVVETWNNVDNAPMIAVNEALGYRLSRTFAMFEKSLATTDGASG